MPVLYLLPKLKIKIGHIEAELRSFDKLMPEEINRVLTDHCADMLFCPTPSAVDNLRREGIIEGVYITGDVMVDTLSRNREIAEQTGILNSLNLESKQYLVATIHRASNTDNSCNLENIVDALCEIDGKVVFPLHPRTAKFLKQHGLYDKLKDKVKLIEPLGYFEFLKLLGHSKKVLTDSGGIQKEAYILKVPCITLRENTEWIETVEDGWNVLVGIDKKTIIKMAKEFEPCREQRNIFGQDACNKIAEAIKDER